MKRILLYCIRIYQRSLSFDTGVLRYVFGVSGSCRYTPTCSEYTYQAIERYGIIYGLFLGLRRVLRCTPWHKGGSDPVPERKT
ncbi:membrane protein insertion efficiency factor YidD [Patescibacteria group bacterium]|nr:membrane protein insertion efficiency factor YidD [Patescibacteria group bacterium]